MGIFANEIGHEGVPTFIAPPAAYPTHGDSGFAALGKPVPFFRRSAGDEALKDMGFDDPEKRYTMIAEACGRIERDDPHGAMEGMFKQGLDATGCYRLLATLLAAAAAPPPPPAEPSYLDLVND